MRGKRMSKAETSARQISSTVETTIIKNVQERVLPSDFEMRSLFTAVTAEKNKSGTTQYLPNLITKSVMAPTIDSTEPE